MWPGRTEPMLFLGIYSGEEGDVARPDRTDVCLIDSNIYFYQVYCVRMRCYVWHGPRWWRGLRKGYSTTGMGEERGYN